MASGAGQDPTVHVVIVASPSMTLRSHACKFSSNPVFNLYSYYLEKSCFSKCLNQRKTEVADQRAAVI